MKRALALLLCWLLAPPQARAAAPAVDARTQLAQLEKSVQLIRRLEPLRPVKAQFVADKTFEAAYARAAQEDMPAAQIEVSQREYRLLGLLTIRDDLHRILLQKPAQDVGAFYDDHSKVLYLRNRVDQVFGLRRDLVAYEYTRALEDQHFHLLRLMPISTSLARRNSDASTAHLMLSEGDAANTQNLFVFRTYSQADLSAYLKLLAADQRSQSLPAAIEREFDFQYTSGLTLVQKVFLKGGMTAVDALYRRLPRSTYEMLHSSAYFGHWKPVPVALHGVQGFDTWKVLDDDVFGALGYDLLLWQFLPKARADRVTYAYRGDRYLFLGNGGQDAMLLESVWSSAKSARAARSAWITSLRLRFRHAQFLTGTGPEVVDKAGSVYFVLHGKRLTAAYASTAALAQQLATEPTD